MFPEVPLGEAHSSNTLLDNTACGGTQQTSQGIKKWHMKMNTYKSEAHHTPIPSYMWRGVAGCEWMWLTWPDDDLTSSDLSFPLRGPKVTPTPTGSGPLLLPGSDDVPRFLHHKYGFLQGGQEGKGSVGGILRCFKGDLLVLLPRQAVLHHQARHQPIAVSALPTANS